MHRLSAIFIIGALILMPILLAAFIAPSLTRYDPLASNVIDRFVAPETQTEGGNYYPLGTDGLGRDIFTRLVYGARSSLTISAAGLTTAFFLGVGLGLISVFGPKWCQWVILRLIDVQLAVPFVILALAIATSFEPSIIVLVCILGIVSWVNFAKMTRGVALVEVNKDYVKAAYVIGCSKPKIALIYVFPNIFPHLLPVMILQFAALIMFEATLSYLGVGLRPPTPSWGGMMLEGQPYMRSAWWMTVMPGLALFFTALGLNLMSEGLRKVVDPRSIR